MTTVPRDRRAPVLTRGAVAEPASSLRYHTGTWSQERPVHRPTPSPCHDACPAGENPRAWLAHVQEGHLRRAWEALVEANPLPAITGRVCPHPCEAACHRGRFDEPLAIHAVERELGDAALAEDWPWPEAPVAPPAAPGRVAIVGAGPAGLSAAWHLQRRGHRPVLLDALPEVGGLLRSAIAPYRLPRDVLDAELARLLAAGVELRLRFTLGRDASLAELAAEHDAVLLAVGAHRPRPWDVRGAVPADARGALARIEGWIGSGEIEVPRCAVIHGGGNTAIDLARILRRQGAEVHVVTASAAPDEGAPPDDTMAALPREVAMAQEEGVVIHGHHTLGQLLLRGGRVRGVELVRLRKLRGPDGRTRRVAFEGTETVLEADMAVQATGEQVDPQGLEAVLRGAPFLPTDAGGAVPGHARLFAAGDACGDCGTVAAAVGSGRRAAQALDRALRGLPEAPPRERVAPLPFERLHLRYFDHRPRQEGALLPREARDLAREEEAGPGRARAGEEAHRCFSCGGCLACDNCWTLCPDSAVLKTPEPMADGSPYVFDLEYCKGCGLCAHECPPGFIAMEPDPGR